MGLLTDPAGLHGRPFQILVKNQGKICVFLYISAVVWYCLLGHEQVNSGTYLSENALLPGLVTVGCDVSNYVSQMTYELERERDANPRGIPEPWIRAKLNQAGILSYTHNFTLNYPLGKMTKYTGKNVYGIIHGGGSGTESIVLCVPYRDPGSVHPRTDPGLVLLLAIGTCFRKQKYWAKDIILLVTEHEQLGMQAWLEAYHGTSCGATGILDSGDLVGGRGGAIQAAVNLELPSSKIYGLDVKLAGLNGQLPNLDLANLVHRICSKERVRHTFANREKTNKMDPMEQWYSALDTITSMVVTQATGVPNGNHGLFHRFGIEAVTLEGFENRRSSPNPVSLYHVGRVIEGVFRSINNLLERFHQSYFFYLLLDTDRFVSIGIYMPCVGLLVGALFLKAFALYLNLKGLMQPVLQESDKAAKTQPDLNSVGVGISLLLCYAAGVVASNSAELFTWYLPGNTETSLFAGYAGLSLMTVVIPALVVKMCYKDKDWILLEIASLVHYATLLIAVAMHNFSLAFLAALTTSPVVMLVGPSRNRLVTKLLLLLTHPLVLLAGSVLSSAALQFPGDELAARTVSGAKQALLLSVMDSLIYGSWTFNVATLFYLPNWCMFWIVAQGSQSCLDGKIPVRRAPELMKTKLE